MVIPQFFDAFVSFVPSMQMYEIFLNPLNFVVFHF